MTTNHIRTRQMQYQITPEDYTALRACLSARSEAERAGNVHTMFFVSYLDWIQDGSEMAVPGQAGAQFALHYYDNDPTYLRLERQLDGQRTSAMVTEAECRALLAGETDWLLNRHDPLFRDFYDALTERMLLPQMMLTFHREIYTADGLDLWVALDTNIRASLQHMDFLDPQQLERDMVGQEGRILMEVSYSDRIPEDVLCLLEETAPRRRLLESVR
ncbi:MAG: hypothetical protein HFF72_04755 [Oscillospiraceae bacterium]|nr:hypothetical protein [Oscillospiraceae bacterium]MCI8719699.1 hypothetical protein [Oscillospiraceae bacterium]MCI8943447.1 hypothetical protein [Oscillospiraceae bacterium]